ncbi:helix-turn-helix domain-containing protein [Enterococcus hirae]|uniref:helix-turn-helix domain-containing protein n=1 Tax=Enterococcus TaxID=1350 RepID=UPI003D151D87
MEENYINNNQFIEELKTKREQYDISQNRLAIACEISRAYLNRIENGKVQVTKKNKKRF